MVGQGFAGRVAHERKPVNITNLGELTKLQIAAGENFTSYYGVPLIVRGDLNGVLEIYNRSPLKIDREWTGLLETFSAHASIAIDSNNLFSGLRRSSLELTLAFDATLEHLSQALDANKHGAPGHTRLAVDLSMKMARALGFNDKQLTHLRRGAMLHDLGVLGVPDAVLTHPGPLSEDEWRLVRRHPQLAYDWLSPIEYLRPALEVPHAHHERWDGSGYPRGLAGEEIPLAARIFAVADVFEALTSDRPYRPAWSQSAALAYLREQRGAQFDPRVIDVFLSLPL
jgi:HD-GYP domain-containing protein (c-di-GMP phosphodiesterase class II)